MKIICGKLLAFPPKKLGRPTARLKARLKKRGREKRILIWKKGAANKAPALKIKQPDYLLGFFN